MSRKLATGVAITLGLAGLAFFAGRMRAQSKLAAPHSPADGAEPRLSVTPSNEDPKSGVAPRGPAVSGARPPVETAGPTPRLEGTPAAPPTGPDAELLPHHMRDRPFRFADGSFRYLFAAQQAAAADRDCWTPLSAAPPHPMPLANFVVEIDAQGRVVSLKPSVKQVRGTHASAAERETQRQLLECLEPFVRAIRFPKNAAQFGQVTAARPQSSAPP